MDWLGEETENQWSRGKEVREREDKSEREPGCEGETGTVQTKRLRQ